MEIKNKKLQSPPYEEMELSQRTGQLLIICLMGRGTPLAITLTLYRLCVKNTFAQGTRRKAQGVWCHMAAPSLGQDASLSLIVRGRERF
jgi:hypothetical protein